MLVLLISPAMAGHEPIHYEDVKVEELTLEQIRNKMASDYHKKAQRAGDGVPIVRRVVIRRKLNEYKKSTGSNESVLVVGTGEKLHTFSDRYYRVDTDRAVLPDYALNIASMDFPSEFSDQFDAVVLERLPFMNFTELEKVQTFKNAFFSLKPKGKLVLNFPATLIDAKNLRSVHGVRVKINHQAGITHFEENSLSIYLSEGWERTLSDPEQKKEVARIVYREIIFPRMYLAGFKKGGLCEKSPYWINSKRGDEFPICAERD